MGPSVCKVDGSVQLRQIINLVGQKQNPANMEFAVICQCALSASSRRLDSNEASWDSELVRIHRRFQICGTQNLLHYRIMGAHVYHPLFYPVQGRVDFAPRRFLGTLRYPQSLVQYHARRVEWTRS